jgi:hypothetical protein
MPALTMEEMLILVSSSTPLVELPVNLNNDEDGKEDEDIRFDALA